MIKISVIIPVYNVEKHLEKCLQSVINQTLQDIEILCVNDGSTDKSGEILEKYSLLDKRIKIFHSNGLGPSKARNIAIKEAQGEYIGFVDSDDWIDIDFYEKLYSAAKNCFSDIACCNILCHRKNEDKYIIDYKKTYYAYEKNEKIALAYLPISNYIWNKIYNREKILKYKRFFVEDRYFEDIEWLTKTIYFLEGIIAIPNCKYHYNKCNINAYTENIHPLKRRDGNWAAIERQKFAEEHNIKFYNYNKRFIKLFGLKFIKIYPYFDRNEYKLFGFIPFITAYKK